MEQICPLLYVYDSMLCYAAGSICCEVGKAGRQVRRFACPSGADHQGARSTGCHCRGVASKGRCWRFRSCRAALHTTSVLSPLLGCRSGNLQALALMHRHRLPSYPCTVTPVRIACSSSVFKGLLVPGVQAALLMRRVCQLFCC